MLAGTVGIVKR